jgi:undecaprenyl-diphosphatase
MRAWHVVERWDFRASQQFNRANHHWVGQLFAVISRLGDGWIWFALMAVLPVVFGSRALAVSGWMLANGALCTLLYKELKAHIHRARPCDADPLIHLTVPPLDRFSFPSGHTLHAVSFSIIVGYYYPALEWGLWPFTILVALSRLVLGLHYLSDVLVGASLGAGMAALTIAVANTLGAGA